MKVNHLTGNPEQFLKLVGESRVDETVYLINPDGESGWMGLTTKSHKVIICLTKPLEILSVHKIFSPLFRPDSFRSTEDNP